MCLQCVPKQCTPILLELVGTVRHFWDKLYIGRGKDILTYNNVRVELFEKVVYRWTSSPVLISSCHVCGASVLIQNSEYVFSFGPCASSDGVPQRCHNVNVSWSQCPHIGGPGPPDTGHITRKLGAVMFLINAQVDKIL